MDQHPDAPEHAPAPTTREIFMGFLGLGLFVGLGAQHQRTDGGV